MPDRFPPGAVAYAKDGRRYVVDEVADGLAYCTAPGGAETEFPESQLMTEAEWAARSGNRRDVTYAKIKQARAYAPYKGPLERAASEYFLGKAEQLYPGLLDFTAFSVASRALDESGDRALIPDLSIVKCRELFESATPQTRAIYYNTPQNPSGVVFTRAEAEEVAAFAIERDLIVIADEAYEDLVYDGEHVSIASLPGMAERMGRSHHQLMNPSGM